ncbi:uncharacterized protein LOC132184020 [Corylus avellana]|uniref:uncharacterized protein LOC132184020 n=1 Tax=Corylus avellana TaxID=13451 RepID=UPI00286CE2A1|nr:uncharacterized protein LOC132184020 [Corylus avellana]
MSTRGKRKARRGSSAVRQSTSPGSPAGQLDDSEQQDVAQLLGIQEGYLPVLPGTMEGETPVHAPYTRAGMAHTGFRVDSYPYSELRQSYEGDVERLYTQHSAGLEDTETEAQQHMAGGVQATDDPQPTNPAPDARLRPRQVRIISTDSEGNTVIEVFTILDSHRRPGVPPGKRIILEYNASCQPVGFSAVRFRRMTGDIVRSENFVRIPDDWTKVPDRTKEDIWDALMAYFFVPPEYNLEAVKNEAFKDMGSKLRTWRHELKKICASTEEDTPDTIRARLGGQTLGEYNPVDLDILLERWCTQENREYAAKMKSLRALNDSPHCTGSMSYARLTHEEAERLGHQPTRAHNYVKSHTKKGGRYPNDIVKERCEKMNELIPTDPAASSSITERTVRWAPNDAFAQAMGNKPEYAGRVRMAGPNILPVRGTIHSYYTPSQARSGNVRYSTISQDTLDRALDAERAKHKEEIDALLAENNARVAQQVAEQMAENNARVARQAAEQEAERQARFDARFRQLEEMIRFHTPPDNASPPFALVMDIVERMLWMSMIASLVENLRLFTVVYKLM